MVEILSELLDRCRRGQPDAVAALVSRFRVWAEDQARSILCDEHWAEDAVQSAFVRALSRLAELRDPKAFTGWLRQIVRNESHLILRRRVGASEPNEAMAANGPSPAQDAEAAERRRLVREAMANLPPAQRESAELFYLHEQSCSEVADVLGVPVGTVKRRLHDARQRLRDMLHGL